MYFDEITATFLYVDMFTSVIVQCSIRDSGGKPTYGKALSSYAMSIGR